MRCLRRDHRRPGSRPRPQRSGILTDPLRLAITRDRLTRRNQNIPAALPAVWAMLGSPARAEALALSVANPAWQVSALAGLIKR